MASTGALTVVATVRFSRTQLDTLIINVSRTDQWCCSNGVAWHGQAGRHAGACMAKKQYQGPRPRGMPEKDHVGVTGLRGQGIGEAEAGTPQRYSQGLQQQQDNSKNVVLQLVKILKVKTSKLVLIY